MSAHADAIRAAYALGWRVREDGIVVSPRGTVRKTYVPPKKPYATIAFRLDRKTAHFYVHKLAAYCKLGEPALALGVVVRHGVGGSLDNRWANLELGTQVENMLDRDPAERRACALTAAKTRRLLTDERVLDLVAEARAGVPRKVLCERFGVLKGQLSEILSGKLYSEVTGIAQRPRTRTDAARLDGRAA